MTSEIETMGDQKMSEDPANAPKTDPLDDPKASGEVLAVAKDTVPLENSLYLEPGDQVLTKDGKVAIVTNAVKIEPEDDPPYNLIDAVVFEVVNGQPKLSAITKGKQGEDWKWPHEE